MRKGLFALMMTLMFFTLPAYGADSMPTASASKSLEQIASEVKILLVKERVHNIFDLFRRLQEYGVTWQPELLASNDLVGKLDADQLSMYAGVKLFDAVYAATFMQRQALSDAVLTIERIQEKLNLRAYADLSGNIFATLKKAAAEPEAVNVQQLLDQLATDYVRDIPALMSNSRSADYLIDALYGFTVELAYTKQFFFYLSGDLHDKLDIGIHKQPDRGEWDPIMVKLFKAFDRMDETVRVSAESTRKIKAIEQQIAAREIDSTTVETDATKAAWKEATAQCVAVRAAILTPPSQ